jgi:hypothetical protein
VGSTPTLSAMRKLEDILADLEFRQLRTSTKFYKPLESPEERKLVIEWYRSQLTLPLEGYKVDLYNDANTKIAVGYNRIVIGDYGAYVEISPEDMVLENIKPKWPGTPKRPVKYIWLETNDELETKIYLQKSAVKYADYQPGLYYVAPADIRKDKPSGDGTCFENRRV